MGRYTYPDHDVMVLNLLEHFEASDGDGETWYRESRRTARRLARENDRTLSCAAGVIAALSPQVRWAENVRMAEEVMRTGETTGLGLSRDRAWRIWLGERPLRVLGGPKTRAFYRAMMGDENAAVIDTWMLFALGWPTSSISPKNYEKCADALREAARLANTGTSTFQAMVWTQVRGGAS
jgi:hypothetical protein